MLSVDCIYNFLYFAWHFRICLSSHFSLGMNHDGKESSFICPDGTYIMSTTSVGKESGYTWSRCSRNYLRQFLRYLKQYFHSFYIYSA